MNLSTSALLITLSCLTANGLATLTAEIGGSIEPLFGSAVLYDSADSILILGGHSANGSLSNSIYRFSLSTGYAELVGEFPIEGGISRGRAFHDGFGTIFYVGGIVAQTLADAQPSQNVWSLDWEYLPEPVIYSTLPTPLISPCIFYTDRTAYAIGGSSAVCLEDPVSCRQSIVKLDTLTGKTEQVLGDRKFTGFGSTCAELDRNFWIFGGYGEEGLTEQLGIGILEPFDGIKGVADGSVFPFGGYRFGTAVTVREKIYLLGGNLESDNWLLVFDILANCIHSQEIVGVALEQALAPSVVYVEKYDRIYVFGGMSGEFGNVYYIQLNTYLNGY